MNKVCLVGRLTASPELKYTTTNIATTRFSVAINRQFKDTDGAINGGCGFLCSQCIQDGDIVL